MDKVVEVIGNLLVSVESAHKAVGKMSEDVDTLKAVIDRQGLAELKPGMIVDKGFCDEEHGELKDHFCSKATKLEEIFDKKYLDFTLGINSKSHSSWVVLVMIIGGMVTALTLLFKEVM